jgi:hypothetical protein
MLTSGSTIDFELALPVDFLIRFRKRADQLRVSPAIARETLEVAKNPACTINGFTSIVQQDVKLAADILKISNSRLFASRTPIVSLKWRLRRLLPEIESRSFRAERVLRSVVCSPVCETASSSLMHEVHQESEQVFAV